MKNKAFAVLTALSLLSSLLVSPLVASAQSAGQQVAADNAAGAFPVKGMGTAASGPVSFDGTLSVARFAVDDGKLMAIGRLAGTLTESATGAKTTVSDREVQLPVQSINGKAVPGAAAVDQGDQDESSVAMLEMAQAAPTCNVLTLVLGPLHLNLLGLVVDLNQINLTITGQTGSGNLLGNLVCAIAGLLDHNNTLAVLTNLLNSIIDLRRLGLV